MRSIHASGCRFIAGTKWFAIQSLCDVGGSSDPLGKLHRRAPVTRIPSVKGSRVEVKAMSRRLSCGDPGARPVSPRDRSVPAGESPYGRAPAPAPRGRRGGSNLIPAGRGRSGTGGLPRSFRLLGLPGAGASGVAHQEVVLEGGPAHDVVDGEPGALVEVEHR